jgi:hypothetical protein
MGDEMRSPGEQSLGVCLAALLVAAPQPGAASDGAVGKFRHPTVSRTATVTTYGPIRRQVDALSGLGAKPCLLPSATGVDASVAASEAACYRQGKPSEGRFARQVTSSPPKYPGGSNAVKILLIAAGVIVVAVAVHCLTTDSDEFLGC